MHLVENTSILAQDHSSVTLAKVKVKVVGMLTAFRFVELDVVYSKIIIENCFWRIVF